MKTHTKYSSGVKHFIFPLLHFR